MNMALPLAAAVDAASRVKCEGKHCDRACRENAEGHECAFCHLAFDADEKCHDAILADLRELKNELAA